jgi:hypothetical protein
LHNHYSRLIPRRSVANASVAQLVEQLTLNQLVPGSNPGRGTTFLHDKRVVKLSADALELGTEGGEFVVEVLVAAVDVVEAVDLCFAFGDEACEDEGG